MIISITGPSRAGENYLKLALLDRFPFIRELCWTITRPLRTGEVQGEHREYVTETDFKKLAVAGELVLSQRLFGNKYGIRRTFLYQRYKWSVTELHINNLIKAFSQGFPLISIGLVPLEIDYLKIRLLQRGTENVSEGRERFMSAKREVRKMCLKRRLFSLLVRFGKENENQVVDRVVSFLEPIIS